MRRYSRRGFLGALGAGAVGSAGLSRGTTAQETPVVEMDDNYFDPVGLHVEPGTTVRFELAAGSHSATAYDDRLPAGATAFDSGTISQGSFEYTFETPGTYDYYCTPHRSIGMVGRIVAGSPGGPAEEGSIPDGEVPDAETIVDRGSVAYGADVDGAGDSDGGRMGPGGPGMMDGPTGGWVGSLLLVGWVLGTLGVGALYWLWSRDRSATADDDSPMATLRTRFARGEIDEETFERRRERLEADEETGDDR